MGMADRPFDHVPTLSLLRGGGTPTKACVHIRVWEDFPAPTAPESICHLCRCMPGIGLNKPSRMPVRADIDL
jgi:hypothetical protein